MKKVVLCLLFALVLCLGISNTIIIANAEEPSDTIQTIIDSEQKEEITNAVLDAIKPYLQEYDNEYVKYFNEKILPSLIGVVVSLILGVCLFAPYIKKVKENNQLKGILYEMKKQSEEKAENENAETLARQEFLDSFKNETGKIALDMNLFSKIATWEKENKALLEQIKNFLLVIGAENSDAVSTLGMTASEKVVEQDAIKIENLENLVRTLSGENADDLIKKAEQV